MRVRLAYRLRKELGWGRAKSRAHIGQYTAWAASVAAKVRAARRTAPRGVVHAPAAPSANIAEVWQAHVLHTTDYAAWCARMTGGGFIPHRLTSPAGTSAHAAEDVLGYERTPAGGLTLSPEFRSRLSAFLCADNGWSEQHAAGAIAHYERWMNDTVRAAQTRRNPPPTLDVDEVWHAHVLHSREYTAWSAALIGRFLHHEPNMPPPGWQDGKGLSDSELRPAAVSNCSSNCAPAAVSNCSSNCAPQCMPPCG
jgi:hypothetical protein